MIVRKKSALRGAFVSYKFIPPYTCALDLDLALTSLFSSLKSLLHRKLQTVKKGYGLKFQVFLHLVLEKYSFENEKRVEVRPFFPSDMHLLLIPSKIDAKLKLALQSAYSKFDSFVEMGGRGWKWRWGWG